MNSAPVDDELLIHRYYECDDQAFDELCRRYKPRLHVYIKWIIGRASDAEDLVQHALLKVLLTKDRSHSQYNPDYKVKFSSWIFTIARHAGLDFLRKHKPEVFFADIEQKTEEGESRPPEWADSAAGEIEMARITSIDISRCMASLNERERICVLLYQDRARLVDIAEVLQCTVADAHRLKEQAFAKLRKCLSKRSS